MCVCVYVCVCVCVCYLAFFFLRITEKYFLDFVIGNYLEDYPT